MLNARVIIQWDVNQIIQKFLSIYRWYQGCCISSIKLFYVLEYPDIRTCKLHMFPF